MKVASTDPSSECRFTTRLRFAAEGTRTRVTVPEAVLRSMPDNESLGKTANAGGLALSSGEVGDPRQRQAVGEARRAHPAFE